jgi:hypothetical protein
LNLIERFRETTRSALTGPEQRSSILATQVNDAIQIEEPGVIKRKVREQDLKLSDWDDIRYQTLKTRVGANWKTYNRIDEELLQLYGRAKTERRSEMEALKRELCNDFREMLRIYELALGMRLQDQYSLYEVCGVGEPEDASPISSKTTATQRGNSTTVLRGVQPAALAIEHIQESRVSAIPDLGIENSPPTLLLMHLSDIHFRRGRSNDPYDLDAVLRQHLADDAEQQVQTLGAVSAVLVSGDIAFSGHADEYVTARQWLTQLGERLGCESKNILTVPGNHDVQRFFSDNDITLSVDAIVETLCI